ncbi:unnamed protein product [Litomosoides sigmodontis]|uniref:Uncharacterized protein n=1 Tax=Litomosoides sigmodontis TaxID=42156 RepID=A0A3P6TLZ7_LITSI|nr:unnamed protein product [Litomosoides sigmodontis]
MILYVAFAVESTTALGGIFGLKALTGNMPYIGSGNPWITYPRVAYGGANFYSPYSSWIYGSNILNGYGSGTNLMHYPYQQYFHNHFQSQPLMQHPLSALSNSLTTIASLGGGGGGRYYTGRGNPWITQP